jgi:hypothetical protein
VGLEDIQFLLDFRSNMKITGGVVDEQLNKTFIDT